MKFYHTDFQALTQRINNGFEAWQVDPASEVSNDGWFLSVPSNSGDVKEWSIFTTSANAYAGSKAHQQADLAGGGTDQNIYRTFTATKELQFEFWFTISDADIHASNGIVDLMVQVDDGGDNKDVLSWGVGANPDNAIQLLVAYGNAGTSDWGIRGFDIDARVSSGGVTNIYSKNYTSGSPSPWTGAYSGSAEHSGFRITITNEFIRFEVNWLNTGWTTLTTIDNTGSTYNPNNFSSIRIRIDNNLSNYAALDYVDASIDAVIVSEWGDPSANEITNVLRDWKLTTAMRGGGQAIFSLRDKDLATLATYEGWIKKIFYAQVEGDGRVAFRGVIEDLDVSTDQVTFTADETIRSKLMMMESNTNPATYLQTLVGFEDTEINDYKNSPFGDVIAGDYISIVDANIREFKASVWSHQWFDNDHTSAFAPGVTFGDRNKTPFDSGKYLNEHSTTENSLGGYTESNSATADDDLKHVLEFVFRFPLKDGTNVTKFTLDLTATVGDADGHAGAGSTDNAKLYVYDYNGTTWEERTEVKRSAERMNDLGPSDAVKDYAWSGTGWNTFLNVNLKFTHEISTSPSNYYNNEVAKNAQDFTVESIKFHLESADQGSPLYASDYVQIGMLIHQAILTVTYDDNQVVAYGVGKVQTATNASELHFDASIVPLEFPIEDGVSVGDDMYFSKDLGTILTNMWTNSGAISFLTLDLDTVTEDLTDISDQTQTSMIDILELYTNWLNREYFQVDEDVKIPSSFPSSQITLTEADIVDWLKSGWFQRISGRNLAAQLRLQGANAVNIALAATPENSATSQTALIRNMDVKIPSQATNYLTNIKATVEQKLVRFIVTLDYNRSDKDYAALEKGKTVELDDTGSIYAYPTLVIIEMHWFELEGKEMLRLTLEKRV